MLNSGRKIKSSIVDTVKLEMSELRGRTGDINNPGTHQCVKVWEAAGVAEVTWPSGDRRIPGSGSSLPKKKMPLIGSRSSSLVNN